MLKKAASTVLLVGVLPFFGLGCEKVKDVLDKLSGRATVGSPCEPNAGECRGNKQALVCVDGKYALRDCKGGSGCTSTPGAGNIVNISCPWSADQEGEKCGKNEEGEAACADDKKAMVICRDSEVRVDPCRGAKGCYGSGDKIHCDISISKAGDPCSGDGFVCSEDKKERLTCKDKKMTVDALCRGPKGCAITGDKIECDRSLVSAGDPCTEEGAAACSLDQLAYLECKGGKMTESMKCKGAEKCAVENQMVRCDWSIGEVGEACNQEGAASCSGDGKKMLVCKGNKLVQTRPCNCKVEGDNVLCR